MLAEIALRHFYLIVVPTTVYNAPAPAHVVEALRFEVKTALAQAFGGYTETLGNGGYVADSGELIEEPVFLIRAAYQTPNDELVAGLAQKIKTALNQETVMIQRDHEVYFV